MERCRAAKLTADVAGCNRLMVEHEAEETGIDFA